MKRFTETTKWSNVWFRKLPPAEKCLWLWLCDNCDSAGVIEPDWEVLSIVLGADLDERNVQSFGDRVVKLPNGKLWLVSFIDFQYGKLSPDCKPHKAIFALLEKHGLQNGEEKERVSKGYPNPLDTLQEKEKEKDKTSLKGEVQERKTADPEKPAPAKTVPAMKAKADLATVHTFCAEEEIPAQDAEWFFHKCEGNGWTNGGKAIKDWRATLRSWKASGYLPSQKQPRGSGNGWQSSHGPASGEIDYSKGF